jgi:hypothetical protein
MTRRSMFQRRWPLRLLAAMWLLALALFLSACGGGDADDDRKDTDPPPCTTNPETCK